MQPGSQPVLWSWQSCLTLFFTHRFISGRDRTQTLVALVSPAQVDVKRRLFLQHCHYAVEVTVLEKQIENFLSAAVDVIGIRIITDARHKSEVSDQRAALVQADDGPVPIAINPAAITAAKFDAVLIESVCDGCGHDDSSLIPLPEAVLFPEHRRTPRVSVQLGSTHSKT